MLGHDFSRYEEMKRAYPRGNGHDAEGAKATEASPHVDTLCLSVADWLARDIPAPDFLLGEWLCRGEGNRGYLQASR